MYFKYNPKLILISYVLVIIINMTVPEAFAVFYYF